MVDGSGDFQKFVTDLQALERRAADLGLWVTMRCVNGAVRAAGWERVGNTTEAIKRAIDRISPEGAP